MHSFKYKRWLCEWGEETQLFYLYTPEEQEQPKGFRYPEMELETVEMCKQFINSY